MRDTCAKYVYSVWLVLSVAAVSCRTHGLRRRRWERRQSCGTFLASHSSGPSSSRSSKCGHAHCSVIMGQRLKPYFLVYQLHVFNVYVYSLVLVYQLNTPGHIDSNDGSWWLFVCAGQRMLHLVQVRMQKNTSFWSLWMLSPTRWEATCSFSIGWACS